MFESVSQFIEDTPEPTHSGGSRSIYIGNSKMGGQVSIDISNPLRIGICAASGSGKTVLLTNILLQLAREMRNQVQFVGFDPKLVSLSCLEPRFTVPIYTEPSAWLPTLNKLEQVMNDRLAEMQRRGWVKIDPFEHGDEFPQIILVIEELPSFVGNSELDSKHEIPLLKKFFDTYLTRARAANMGMIACSHTFSSTETISTLARSQFMTRLIGKCGVSEAHLFNEGQDEKCNVLRLTSAGEWFIADKGNFNQWQRFKTWMTDEQKAFQMCKDYSIDNRDIGLGWTVASPFDD